MTIIFKLYRTAYKWTSKEKFCLYLFFSCCQELIIVEMTIDIFNIGIL